MEQIEHVGNTIKAFQDACEGLEDSIKETAQLKATHKYLRETPWDTTLYVFLNSAVENLDDKDEKKTDIFC